METQGQISDEISQSALTMAIDGGYLNAEFISNLVSIAENKIYLSANDRAYLDAVAQAQDVEIEKREKALMFNQKEEYDDFQITRLQPKKSKWRTENANDLDARINRVKASNNNRKFSVF
ncbi:hypothetical protein TVAG_246770 [Trichomonas vaginalis G3]|uniref:Uncharacterized protein n=1 Tax=Trichomonas vaginalis (strain ATCC PRA-98 / G3) TaxID=412133 RepID=A2DKL6_TRIV3|nr:hypothetical protein TVAGG3_0561260 [Trichomonas vaginalis G3]EAY18999.1 hypothetical protein TVAG_246770 [Trichomonas vaginalis G3]KAI5521208.1 hypothetical protein TVAGG3_0561260 [Trichomonas vaginalis G3]|eukprot:XP_001579985.1 hypothetical protein [Trichomonas vaginalis G3]